jgi:hypothetical protein
MKTFRESFDPRGTLTTADLDAQANSRPRETSQVTFFAGAGARGIQTASQQLASE